MAYGQPDGELILEEFSGDIEYTDEGLKEMYMDGAVPALHPGRYALAHRVQELGDFPCKKDSPYAVVSTAPRTDLRHQP